MKIARRAWAIGIVALAAVVLLSRGCGAPSEGAAAEAVVTSGEFSAWSVYDGVLDARRVEAVMSKLNGPVTITDLVPEGTAVKKGDLLARFDCAPIEGDLVKFEHDGTLAKLQLESLEKAELPMELLDLQTQALEARFNYNSEKQYLEDSRPLLEKQLISQQELQQQELKVQGLKSKLDQIESRLKLTTEHLHPSKLERARADLATAEQQLKTARAFLDKCSLKAPSDGQVAYSPLNVGGEFRTVRVGDTVYKNQTFMYIPDMSELVVRCYVPEADLSRVQPGMTAIVAPVAYPASGLTGAVESVSAMAQARPGYPGWQKYFHVVIGLEGTDPRLRTGISVNVSVLSSSKARAVLIPRTAVRWADRRPVCRVLGGRGPEERELELGAANDQYYEVVRGVEPGERVQQ